MLEIKNLTVDYYRKGKTIRAVDDFSLSISPGETMGLVGESGSGKSTVALAILRLIRAQEGKIVSGRIELDGEDLLTFSDERLRRVRGKKISMIFQDPFTALNPVMRIKEQMQEVGGQDSKTLGDSLKRVQLEPERVLGSYPHQLSGGQRQRVMIAMALLLRPALVLADEPTTALDVIVQKDILELLFNLQKEMGMAMLFISHNLGIVATHTQRLAVMKAGRIVEQGVPKEIFQHPTQPYTRQLLSSLPAMMRSSPC